MNEYSFSLPYPPSNNRYYRHSRGFHYISKVGEEYREQVRDIIELLNLNINLPCRLAIAIYAAPPDNRIRDLDNIPKCLFDSLTYAGFWRDDGQIDSIKIVRCRKVKG